MRFRRLWVPTTVEILIWSEWDKNGRHGEPPEPISPLMLYYYARRYDDIPGDDDDKANPIHASLSS